MAEKRKTPSSLGVSWTTKHGEWCFINCGKLSVYENGKKVPHLYSNGSLCLYYPEYQEWNYRDSWAETLIPWTSLWLFYYEIWKETGNWLGGGIHGSKSE